MIDPKNIDLNKLPKKLCDGALGGHNKEIFTFALTSGNHLDSFAATPTVMKSISVWVAEQVATYERKYGTIDVKPQDIESPIQPSDLDADTK
jgi:hypothetical protein